MAPPELVSWGPSGAIGIVDITSEFYESTRVHAKYVVQFLGGSLGGPLGEITSGIDVTTPSILGLNPGILTGFLSWFSATASIAGGYSLTQFTMGFGLGTFSPNMVLGTDVGLDVMGGISIPVYWKKK